ncbi:MAG TPA: hypothetical protein VN681_00175, partial [Stellaceae bacterium]|nr:hypothetical protein [Stellaceae bacterium]
MRRGASAGGACCHVWEQLAQRTKRPALPSARGSTKYRVEQTGQVTIIEAQALSFLIRLQRRARQETRASKPSGRRPAHRAMVPPALAHDADGERAPWSGSRMSAC